jgi:nicotinamide mononucleotide transporter
LISGLLAVIWLIRQNILTWPSGIVYVLASLIIFWRERLYADLALHVFYLFLNGYGWYYWAAGKKRSETDVPVTTTSGKLLLALSVISLAGIVFLGWGLHHYTDASLPYWDSATTILSFTGMWLTARKKIENWFFWFIVDVMATGVYYHKGIYFYAFLYMIYIGMAISGYVAWKKAMRIHRQV